MCFRARRVVKTARPIVGASLEDIHKKRQQAVKAQKAAATATEAALKEVKDRTKSAQKSHAVKGPAAQANIPKHQKSSFNARGGSKR